MKNTNNGRRFRKVISLFRKASARLQTPTTAGRPEGGAKLLVKNTNNGRGRPEGGAKLLVKNTNNGRRPEGGAKLLVKNTNNGRSARLQLAVGQRPDGGAKLLVKNTNSGRKTRGRCKIIIKGSMVVSHQNVMHEDLKKISFT